MILRVAAWLLALGLIALPVVALINGWVGVERFPLSKLRVHGEFRYVQPEQLRGAILPQAQRGFFAVRLDDIRRGVEALPWVESAQVGKEWPDVLEISVIEHKPFAHWGQDRLLSEHGRLFARPEADVPERMPHLEGPDARVEDVTALYHDAGALFAPLGLRVETVAMDARGSWSLRLGNGTEVVVGREDARLRLARFVRLLPHLGEQQAQPLLRADLRYTNGFALRWGSAAQHTQRQAQAWPQEKT